MRDAITRDEDTHGNVHADNPSTVGALVTLGLALPSSGGVWFTRTDRGRAVRDAATTSAHEVRMQAERTDAKAAHHAAVHAEPRQDVDECRCVVSCGDDPATMCSLSGQPHVHPDDGTDTFGRCLAHPDAPGDL